MDKKLFKKGIAYLEKKDPVLKKIIQQVEDYPIIRQDNYFQALCESIISQQLAAKAAEAICRRFLAYFAGKLDPQTVDQTSPEDLRGLGLSQSKVRYIKDLAHCCLTDKVKLAELDSLSDQEVIGQLVQVKGIGKWTAEIFLIFGMGRMDILPADDLGIKKAIQALYRLPELPVPAMVQEMGENWLPYRTIAALYLWKSLNNT